MVMFEAIEDVWTQVGNFNEYTRALVTLATTVGAIYIIFQTLSIAYKLAIGFKLYCLTQCRCFQSDYVKKYGKWAVISGATDGIGLSMARELARRGMSIVVIGRNEEKLANVKSSLEQEANAGEILTVKIDLSNPSADNFDRVQSQIDPFNRDIGMLINNAGTFPDTFQRFLNNDREYLMNMMNLNMAAPVLLTKMILPGMVKRSKGLVVNVSSTLGCIPAPYISIYGPSKTFLNSFSRMLQIEYSDHNVEIVNLTPGAVHTNLLKASSKLAQPTMASPTPEEYARKALNALSAGVNDYCGTAIHGLGRWFGGIFDTLGLIPILFRINLSLNARKFQLSPVSQRKQPVGARSDEGGDGAQASLRTGN